MTARETDGLRKPGKEKPADPIVSQMLPAEPGMIPALSPAKSDATDNMDAPAILASAVRSLQHIDAQIAALNGRKSGIYGELKHRGFTGKQVRRTVAALRLDPIARREQAELDALYMRAFESAVARIDAERAAQAKPADGEPA